jgi:uncharacterized protein involved in exopolysaccharide biosynthesis
MENDVEIDLNDYIDTIKKERSIILTVFLVALISGAVFSFSQPNIYENSATLYVQKLPLRSLAYVPSGENLIQIYSPSFVKNSLSSEHLLRQTTTSVGLDKMEPFVNLPDPAEKASDWIKKHMKIIGKESGLIQLQIKGELEPNILKSILDSHIKLLIVDYDSRLESDIQSELRLVDEKYNLFLSQKVEVVKSISEIDFDSTSENELMIMLYLALSSDVNEINNKLRALEVYKMDLEVLSSSQFDGIKIIDPPIESNVPVEDQRKVIKILLAGILGLFVGILVAFFKDNKEKS